MGMDIGVNAHRSRLHGSPSPEGSSQPAAALDPDEALDQLLRQIISGMFVLTDGQGALSKWSDPAEMLFGLSADDVLGQPFFGRLVDPAGLTPAADGWR